MTKTKSQKARANAGKKSNSGAKRITGRGAYATQARPMMMRGRGGFWGDLWNQGKSYVPRLVGGGLGYLAGGSSGAKRGWDIGENVSKNVLGWGDYSIPWSVVGNTLISQGSVPTMHETSDSSMRVGHKEFLGPIYSSTGFTNRVFDLNPGLSTTFPWLSQIAGNFQQYRMLGAMIVFKPSLPDGIASFASLGNLIIACQMNAAAPAFTTQLEMEQVQFGASSKPTIPIAAPVECSPELGSGMRNLLIRTGAVPVGSVKQSYDHCNFQVATVGQGSAGVLMGNLYITYDLQLLNPTFGAGRQVQGASYDCTTASVTHLFGTAQTKRYDTIGLTVGDNVLTFPVGFAGRFEFIFQMSGSSSAAVPPVITPTNATMVGSAYYAPYLSTVCTLSMIKEVFQITNPSVAVVLTLAADTFSGMSSSHFEVNDVSELYA